MNVLKIMTTGAIVSIFSVAISMQANAQSADQTGVPDASDLQQAESMDHMQMHQQHMQQAQAGNMPMMGAGCDHMKKDPAMMDNMMQMRQQRMWQGAGPQGRMPMMDPDMRNNMMQMRQQKMMQMKQRGMMRSEMMQMRQQHMKTMEQRLGNIEKLLAELVELQKKQ